MRHRASHRPSPAGASLPPSAFGSHGLCLRVPEARLTSVVSERPEAGQGDAPSQGHHRAEARGEPDPSVKSEPGNRGRREASQAGCGGLVLPGPHGVSLLGALNEGHNLGGLGQF